MRYFPRKEDSRGKKSQDVWWFKDSVFPVFPTEKNHPILEQIIKALSELDRWYGIAFAGRDKLFPFGTKERFWS